MWCYLVCNRDDKCDTRYGFSLFTVFFSRALCVCPFNIYHSWAGKQTSKNFNRYWITSDLFVYFFLFYLRKRLGPFRCSTYALVERIGIVSEIRKTIHDYVMMKIENKKWFQQCESLAAIFSTLLLFLGILSSFHVYANRARISVFPRIVFFSPFFVVDCVQHARQWAIN